jgi:hypothetical protein
MKSQREGWQAALIDFIATLIGALISHTRKISTSRFHRIWVWQGGIIVLVLYSHDVIYMYGENRAS